MKKTVKIKNVTMLSNYNLRPAATVTMFYVPVQFLCSSTLKFANKRRIAKNKILTPCEKFVA